jgi:type I restriction enzyme S subunit
LHQRTYAIFNFKNIDGKYLFYHIYNYDGHLKSHAVGSTVKSLRLPMFQSMPVKVPCIGEQVLIADFLSKVNLKLDIERNILEEFLSQKKYLTNALFI